MVLTGGGVLTSDVLNFVYDTNTLDPTFSFFRGNLDVGSSGGDFNYNDNGNDLVRNWNAEGTIESTEDGSGSESGSDAALMMEIAYDTNDDGIDELFVLILPDYFPINEGDEVPLYSISINGADQGGLGGYGENKDLVDAALAAIAAA